VTEAALKIHAGRWPQHSPRQAGVHLIIRCAEFYPGVSALAYGALRRV